MVKSKRRKRRRRKLILKAVVILLVVIGIGALIVWKVFTVETVKVEGNNIYSDEKIENWVLNDEYSWNSLYVYFKYKFTDMKEIPFVDSMEVSIKSPHTLQVDVYEKGVLGYVYIPSLGKNAYIDKDGFVVEISSEVIDGTTKISGLTVATAELYEKLPLENMSILKTLLNVSQLLKKYELLPNTVFVTENDQVLLNYGNIQVNVGGNVNLNEKIVRLQQIMPKVQEMTGTIHLEDWSENNTDIYFVKDELTEIPNDVQSVPTTGEDDSAASEEGDTDPEGEDTPSEGDTDPEGGDTPSEGNDTSQEGGDEPSGNDDAPQE